MLGLHARVVARTCHGGGTLERELFPAGSMSSLYVLAGPRVDTSAAGRSTLATPAVGSYFAEFRRAKSQGRKASLRSTA